MTRYQRDAKGVIAETLLFAVPTLVTLIAEPVFLAVDSIVVGHLGVAQLAALGVTSAILGMVTSSFIVLTYGTTSRVARLLGSGDELGALEVGVSSTWLGFALGIILSLALLLSGSEILRLLHSPLAVLPLAERYLSISSLGIPFVLVNLAGVGTLRGMGNARSILSIQVIGYILNIALNVTLVFGLGLGIGGSAIGTVTTQFLIALAYVVLIRKASRKARVRILPDPSAMLGVFSVGVPLIVRTLSVRVAILAVIWVAESQGTIALAAFGASMTIWSILAFVLDSVAISAQVIFGKAVGAGRLEEASAATSTFIRLAVVFGLVTGVVEFLLAHLIPEAFVASQQTQRLMSEILQVQAPLLVIASVVYMLDGILIGVGDFSYLAHATFWSFVIFVPGTLLVRFVPGDAIQLWFAFSVFIFARGITLIAWITKSDWIYRASGLGH